MPYIPKERREALEQLHTSLRADRLENAGELNYAVTLLLKAYTEQKGRSYQTMNDVVGALEGAKAEYQRRVIAPYENLKILENGDVYTDGGPALEEVKEDREVTEAP